MKRSIPKLREVLTALLTAAVVLLSTTLLAQQVSKSSFYRQSEFLSMLVKQDEIGMKDILENKETVIFATKFAEAVTDAYISFELIPVYEANTFMAIFESLNSSISVDRFSYVGNDIIIFGKAQDDPSYEAFLAALQETEHFSEVTGRYYITTDDLIKFEITCRANIAGTVGLLPQGEPGIP